MNKYQEAWESFLETGTIDDYMTYCTKRKEELYAAMGGATAGNATESERHRPPGQKDGG